MIDFIVGLVVTVALITGAAMILGNMLGEWAARGEDKRYRKIREYNEAKKAQEKQKEIDWQIEKRRRGIAAQNKQDCIDR